MIANRETDRFPGSHPLTATLLESLVWEHRTSGSLERLLDLAASDGTGPLWLAYLERSGRFGRNDANGGANGATGEPANAARATRAIKTRLAVHRRQIERTADALDGLDWLVLKGEPLSVQIFGEAGLREASDVDILVARDAFDEAVDRLNDLGYRGDVVDMKEWTYNQLAMYPSGGGLPVEVHWRVARPVIPAPETESLLERRQMVQIPMGAETGETLEVPVLGTDDLLAHLAYHFHQHHGMLKGLADITAWIDCFGEERALSVRQDMRREFGASGLLDWALDTLDQLTGARLGPGSDDPFVAMWSRWSARQIYRRYRELEETEHTMLKSGASPQTPSERLRDAAGKVVGTARWAMGMLALDRWDDKLTACARAGVLGPHRIGRMVQRLRPGGRGDG